MKRTLTRRQVLRSAGVLGATLGEFIDYAHKHPGVVFMRKDEIARFALAQQDTPREGAANL